MEIADVYTVNKADRPGADRLRNDIELMLGLRAGAALQNVPAHHGVDLRSAPDRDALRDAMNPARAARAAAQGEPTDHWTPPVLRSIAAQQEGITEIADALDRHFRYLERSGELRSRRRARLRERVMEVVEQQVRQRLWRDAGTLAWIDDQLDGLEAGTLVPFAVADALRARSEELLTGASFAPLQHG
jgi:LAO/AO transport system kinase